MDLSRREMIKLLGASTASCVMGGIGGVGQGHARSLPRMPLEEFAQDAQLLAALRKGVRAMKKRKPSDPLSWFYQAAIHGVTDDAVKKAAADDSGVDGVFRKRYWNQCPHDGENSANFLPWHRGYTYYFERILRMHTEDDRFSLPYWNYTERGNRKFPKEFGIKHLDGNINNESEDNINPLYLAERDFYFTGYEHPFATGLPLLELTETAVDISLPMNSPVFFGETEREGLGGGIADEDPSTRGLLESYPHDQIHRSVGGIIDATAGQPAVGAMATPPTAGFDPIFSIHHANIDRLWVEWSCMPGKKWGKLPSDYWFNERPWFFYDIDGKIVNEPRKKFFDHRALGIRFKYENMKCTPLALPNILEARAQAVPLPIRRIELLVDTRAPLAVLPATKTSVPLKPEVKQHLSNAAKVLKSQALVGGAGRLILRLTEIELGTVQATGFDLHLTATLDRELRRTDSSFIGSVAMFRHSGEPMSESFDISKTLSALENDQASNLKLVAIPYSLLTVPGKDTLLVNKDYLRVGGMQVLRTF